MKHKPQYSNIVSVICDYPTSDTCDIVELALRGLHSIWRDVYRYAKADVKLGNFYQSNITQYYMFSAQQPQANADVLKNAVDSINRSGKGKVWFAGQDSVKSAWQMKRTIPSPRYTTRLAEILTVK